MQAPSHWLSVCDLLRVRASTHGARELLRFERRRATIAEVNARSSRLAALLGTLGVCRGDRVAILLPNGIEFRSLAGRREGRIDFQPSGPEGLVTGVVPADRLREEALSFAGAVTQAAPQSIDVLKQALLRTREIDLDAMLALESDEALSCLSSADAHGRLRTFVERRQPGAGGLERS